MNFDLGVPVATAALEEPPAAPVYHQHNTMGCKQEESPKKPQVTRMTAQTTEIQSSVQNFFRVDPDRHRKNKLDKLSRLPYNVYTAKPIVVERNVRQVPSNAEL